MIRTIAVAAILLATCSQADAQIRAVLAPRSAGVLTPPSLPLAGSPLQHMTVAQPHFGVRPDFMVNPYYYPGTAYPTYYPWYNTVPSTVVNNVILPPPPIPEQVLPTAPPSELRARLSLNIPTGSKVTMGGKEIDTAVVPLILESPVLTQDQRYLFDVKVKWVEGGKTEERTRTVAVDAGDTKSLTYFAAK